VNNSNIFTVLTSKPQSHRSDVHCTHCILFFETCTPIPEPAGAKDKHDGEDGGRVGDQSQRGAQFLGPYTERIDI
jgi:hypothetical protein